MKVLLSAYSCDPGKGSEPGVGWNSVLQAARFHSVWVLTHDEGRQGITAALASGTLPNVRFVYRDLPRWGLFWKKDRRGTASPLLFLAARCVLSWLAGCTAKSASTLFIMSLLSSTLRHPSWHCCQFPSYGVRSVVASQHHPRFGGRLASEGRSSSSSANEPLLARWASTTLSFDALRGGL